MNISKNKTNFVILSAKFFILSLFLSAAGYSFSFNSSNISNASGNATVVVHHMQRGVWDTYIYGVGYDVDSSSSVYVNTSFKNRSLSILPALPNKQALSIYFHFLPNVMDLTSLYAQAPTLYNYLIASFASFSPYSKDIMLKVDKEVKAGDRIYLLHDFIPFVYFNGTIYTEQPYVLILNLDKRWAKELVLGKVMLHDPHIDELKHFFNTSNSSWEMCLRGNTKLNKYNGIVIDSFPEPPYFAIRRAHLVCLSLGNQSSNSSQNSFSSSLSLPPLKRIKPPPAGGGVKKVRGEVQEAQM